MLTEGEIGELLTSWQKCELLHDFVTQTCSIYQIFKFTDPASIIFENQSYKRKAPIGRSKCTGIFISSFFIVEKYENYLKDCIFFFNFYLFMIVTERVREAETQAEGEAGPMPGAWDLILGPQDHAPGQRQALNC